MNRKEIREIKKRFRPELDNFGHIYGCYVNAAGETVADMDMPVIQMDSEEKEMYCDILKKTLSGSLGRNLMNIDFATSQVADSEEHRMLQALRMSRLADEEIRRTFYRRVIECCDLKETGYVILLAADSYDVPYKTGSSEEWDEDSTEQYDYFVCAVCPVKDTKAALRYRTDDHLFRGASTGNVLASPQMGFLFPCFDDRMTNIYSALYYTRSASDAHESFIRGIFNTERPPMAAAEQKETFAGVLSESLAGECSMEVVRSVQTGIREKIQEHKESHNPNAPEIRIDEIDGILMQSGVSDEHIENFHASCEEHFGGEEYLNPDNIVDTKKFRIHMPETDITVDPEQAGAIQTKEIDGHRYLLIPLSEGTTVNGIELDAPES